VDHPNAPLKNRAFNQLIKFIGTKRIVSRERRACRDATGNVAHKAGTFPRYGSDFLSI
jgi:hypothetical protein